MPDTVEPTTAVPVTVPSETLLRQTKAILEAWGAPPDHVEIIANRMHESDLRGIDSHGVGMLPKYEEDRLKGAINFKPDIKIARDFGATALIDADHALGHVPGTKAMELAVEKARQFGVGIVNVRNSNHYGAAGVYALLASKQGMIGISTTGTTSRSVVPTFAKEARFSTNPIAFAAPATKNPPFVLDMATSTVAVGKINIARRAGKPLPVGWATALDGGPETDAEAAFNVIPKRLTPLGGTRELGSHKGYGLAMMVEILSSVLGGSFVGGYNPASWERETHINVGHFMMAINPDCFVPEGGPGGDFGGGMDQLIDMLHDTPAADPAHPVQVAGDAEFAEEARRRRDGIPMVPKLIEEVREVARSCGAAVILGD